MVAGRAPSTLICVFGDASGVPGKGDTVIPVVASAVARAAVVPAAEAVAPAAKGKATTTPRVATNARPDDFSDTVSDTATQL